MVLTVDPQGAGLESVILNGYYDTAAHKALYKFQEPIGGVESVTRPLATRTLTIDGHDIDVSSAVNWQQISSDKSSATYAATIKDGAAPLIELTKRFTLQPSEAPDGSKGFDVAVSQRFQNLTGKIIKFSVTVNGPTPPARENDRSEDRRYVAGYDAGDKFIETGSTSLSELKKDKPAKDLVAADSRPMMWVGACSSYFESIFRPDLGNPSVKIASADVVGVDSGDINAATDLPTSLAITTNEVGLAPGARPCHSMPISFSVPSSGNCSAITNITMPSRCITTPRSSTSAGLADYITFTWLINLLYGILWFFHSIFRDWGIAIICLVCLVRVMLHPITKKSQINMLQMGKMGPEIERLKKKYGDNKDELNKAMMGVYKEQGLTPILGCLPMFLADADLDRACGAHCKARLNFVRPASCAGRIYI